MNRELLLLAIEKNGRIDYKELADIVDVDVDSVKREVDLLIKDNIICGFNAVIDWNRFSNEKVKAIIEVSAKPTKDYGYDEVASKIMLFDEVEDLYLVSGKSEFMVVVNGKSMKEVASFVSSKLAPIQGVSSTVTSFVLNTYKINSVKMSCSLNNHKRLLVSP